MKSKFRVKQIVCLLALVFFIVCLVETMVKLRHRHQIAAIHILESAVDFGMVAPESTVHHDFVIENVGQADLVIRKITKGCGCTEARIKSDRIPEGSHSVLSVDLSLKQIRGRKSSQVILFTNDPTRPVVMLQLTAKCVDDVEPAVEQVSFGIVDPQRSESRVVRCVRVNPSSSTTITAVDTSSKAFDAELVPGDGDLPQIRISTRPPFKAGINVGGLIRIWTDGRYSGVPMYLGVSATVTPVRQ